MVNNKQTPANPRAKPKIKIFAIFERISTEFAHLL